MAPVGALAGWMEGRSDNAASLLLRGAPQGAAVIRSRRRGPGGGCWAWFGGWGSGWCRRRQAVPVPGEHAIEQTPTNLARKTLVGRVHGTPSPVTHGTCEQASSRSCCFSCVLCFVWCCAVLLVSALFACVDGATVCLARPGVLRAALLPPCTFAHLNSAGCPSTVVWGRGHLLREGAKVMTQCEWCDVAALLAWPASGAHIT